MRYVPGWMVGLSASTLVALSAVEILSAADGPSAESVRRGLTFYASFDTGPDADFALGDRHIYSSASFDNLAAAERGFHTKEMTRIAPHMGIQLRGKASGALQFTQAQSPVVFFRGEKNIAYRPHDWSGTVSLWLRVDPQRELAPGYCDPIQITTRAWNDAAFFVDFDKETSPRDFRFGSYSDTRVWNPTNRPYEQIPPQELPLIPVKQPPFSSDRWTHVVFTWDQFNSDKDASTARFYLNGEARGELAGSRHQFSWKDEETLRLFLGVYYIGLLDDVACFDRPLSAEEIKLVYQLQGDIKPNRQ